MQHNHKMYYSCLLYHVSQNIFYEMNNRCYWNVLSKNDRLVIYVYLDLMQNLIQPAGALNASPWQVVFIIHEI